MSFAHDDEEWAQRIQASLRPTGLEVWKSKMITDDVDWEKRILEQVDRSSIGLVLVSAHYLGSALVRKELSALIDAADRGGLTLTWVLLSGTQWGEDLGAYQSLHDPNDGPLDAMDRAHQARTLAQIARALVSVAGARTPGDPGDSAQEGVLAPDSGSSTTQKTEPEPLSGFVDVDVAAAKPFRADTSVANGSSLAFLMEFGDRSVLVGGDSFASVLEHSIRRLLGERGETRLRVDAFVVPHNGSERNLSRALLELLACDRYLISSNGALFRHPDLATIARIITYGRSAPNARPAIVFNYRTRDNEMWDDPKLQEQYRYEAVYPDRESAGIKVRLR